jgi:diacylglycerol kinase (ATP)
LRAAGVTVEELTGRDADELRAKVRRAIAAGVDALVVVGGDGMVQLGVGAVAQTGVPLGIIAAGTGNDVARALALPIRDPEAAVAMVLRGLAAPEPGSTEGHRHAIDAIRCVRVGQTPGGESDHWYAGVLGAGFDALVNERANRWNRPRGRSRYVLAMLRELPVFRPRSYTLELDGERRVCAAMLVAVANGPSYGGGMRVCPDAVLDDGLLDLMMVEPLSRIAFLSIFPRVYAGTHVSDPRVIIWRGSRVTLDAPGIVAYADGERIGPLPLTCEIVGGAVLILAPRAGPTADR